jgi:hypothetical protein
LDLIPILIISLVLLTGFAFRLKQSRGSLGGTIAVSKTFWLSYTIISWFILPLILIYKPYSIEFKIVLASLSLSMWVRGLIELIMLYKYKNWKPIYGLVHNVFTLLIMLLTFIFNNPSSTKENIYLISISCSLGFEIYYAHFFHKYLGKKTEGDNAVWFANKEDPLYRKNLQVTTVGNVLLYSILFYFLY